MKIIAHRGYSADYAENTPQSWDAALAAGAHAIETDIRFSSDGIAVCAHDDDLDRLFGRPERVSDVAWPELEALESPNGARIARLADVLAYAGNGHYVLLDLKDESPQALERIWQIIVAEVPAAQHPLVIAGCHGLEAVRFFGARGATILGFIPAPDMAEAFWQAGATTIRLWEGDVSPARVTTLQALGAEVWVTSGGDGTSFDGGDHNGTDMAGLAAIGVGGVLVNDVALAVRQVASLG
ncbi:glycerophosphodiester phosphodiesterase [Devosia beringensis]|uniref:glycerophosphodiester phosphodiesterase n=1 Tax=Devosia beringensis TaxID=2657486 RepID=UPI00186BA9A2|nr:glycerophosphodiester phosphodiesterase family protein [Devosia beringensis]